MAGDQPLAVTVDATPLLGRPTGIGRYVRHLVDGLAERDDIALAGTAFSLRGRAELAGLLPPGVGGPGRPAPARLLRTCWRRLPVPPGEWFFPASRVFHGTNFVLPPLRRTAGVLTVHDLAFVHLPETVHRASADLVDLVPRGLRRAGAVCTPTQAVADDLIERWQLSPDKVVVTPLGVAAEWHGAIPATESVRARWGVPAEYLLFVGTREPRKGLPTLLAAHRQLRQRDPDVPPLVLIGPRGWGNTESPGPDVLTVPFVDQADLPGLVAAAGAVVMPSRYEGFGLPVLEAMATGTPVVVSEDPAMLEVAGGWAGTFPVGDVDALADRLAAVLGGDHPEPADLRRYAAGWTWDRCVDRTVAAYRQAAG